MRSSKWLALVALAGGSLAAAAPSLAASLFFDFGATTTPTGGAYNDVPPAVSHVVANAIDSTSAATGISLITAGFNEAGPNTNGTTSPGAPANVFASTATQDNLFGHTDNFNVGSPRPSATLTLAGLDGSGATTYNFTFFASRTGVTDNRETEYAVSGLNNGTGFLNASSNTSNVALVSGIKPTAGGQILITVQPGPNNNNPSRFFYLGAMLIESSRVPEPGAGALLVSSLGLTAVRRRRR